MPDSSGFGWRLRWAREQAGLSQGELGRRARVSRSTVALAENGTEPGVRKAVALYEVLARELPGLSLEWLLMGRGDRIIQALPGAGSDSRVRRYDGGGAQTDPLAWEAPQETPTHRSTFLRGSIGLAWMAASVDPVIQAIAYLCSFEGRLAGRTIDGFEELVADFGHDYSRRSPRTLVAQLQAALPPLAELVASSPSVYRSRLESTAGWLAALLANALYDFGEITAAKVRLRAAFEHGQRAGDNRLMAFACYKQAMFASDMGDVARALRYVEEGLLLAPAHTAISCRLLDYQADHHVRLGRREPAIAALRELEKQYERLPSSEVGNGSFNVSRVFVAEATRASMRHLGDYQAAERSSIEAIEHYRRLEGEARRPTRLAWAQLSLAEVMVRTGRPDEACATASEALGTERMVHGLLRECGAFDAILTGQYPDLLEARDFHERYVTLAHLPASTTS